MCVDVGQSDGVSNYPMITNNPERRRIIYWRCVMTFFLTSIKYNRQDRHILFTNDNEPIIIDDHDVKHELEKRGVEIRIMPFTQFNPGSHSRTFRNAFYKLEVLDALANEKNPSILLDNDCIWSKRDDRLFSLLAEGNYLFLEDTYQRSETPLRKKPFNLSMKEMGDCFKSIPVLKSYKDYPVWYGGELIGGSPYLFRRISEALKKTMAYCISQSESGNEIVFQNGNSIFHGMELITSYVYNSFDDIDIYDTQGEFSKRMWTIGWPNNYQEGDITLAIWHVTAEKESGLKRIYYELIKESSPFWTEPDSDQAKFLGSFVNIPNKKFLAIYQVIFRGKELIKSLFRKMNLYN